MNLFSKTRALRVALPLAVVALGALVPATGFASGTCTATPNADCKGATMTGMSMKGADMRGADMRGADMSRMDMSGMDLRGADMRGADMSHANMKGADMRGAKLDGANMSHAVMGNANMSGMTLKNVKLTGASMRGAKLVKAKITGGKWNDMTLHNVNIGGAVLTNVDFSGTRFNGVINRKVKNARSVRNSCTPTLCPNSLYATVDGGKFDNAVYDSVELTNITFTGSSTWRSTQFINSHLWHWNFTGHAYYFETTGLIGNSWIGSTFGGNMWASWWTNNNNFDDVTCNYASAVPAEARVWGVGGGEYSYASGRGDADPLVIGNFGAGSYNQGPEPTQTVSRSWWNTYQPANNHGNNSNCTWSPFAVGS